MKQKMKKKKKIANDVFSQTILDTKNKKKNFFNIRLGTAAAGITKVFNELMDFGIVY